MDAFTEAGNPGLKMPKESLIIENAETGEIIARKGKWTRLPMDGEPLRSFYLGQHQEKYKDLL